MCLPNRHYEKFEPHLVPAEDLVPPDGLWHVFVWDHGQLLQGDLLQLLEVGVVDKADGHQVGGVLALEEVENLVLEVLIRLWVDVESSPGASGELAERVLGVGGGPLYLEVRAEK